jgi:hypothetical protein
VLAACSGTTAPVEDPCAGSLAAGEVEVFATGFDRDIVGTEGLTFGPTGRLFVGGSGVSGDGYVAEIRPDGTWEILADVSGSVGLAWWDDALLVAAEGDKIVAVDPDARTTRVLAEGLPGSNFPAVTPWDTLLLSAPDGSELFEITRDGTWSTWATDVPSPNGIGFSPDGTEVYVANTYRSPSTVARIPVTDGVAGAVGVLATLPDGSTQDGVAMDVDGNLYVVNNLPGTIARIAPDGTWEIVAEGVDFGASLAFGEGPFDACSVYVSSLFSEDVIRVGIGVEGAPPHR